MYLAAAAIEKAVMAILSNGGGGVGNVKVPSKVTTAAGRRIESAENRSPFVLSVFQITKNVLNKSRSKKYTVLFS